MSTFQKLIPFIVVVLLGTNVFILQNMYTFFTLSTCNLNDVSEADRQVKWRISMTDILVFGQQTQNCDTRKALFRLTLVVFSFDKFDDHIFFIYLMNTKTTHGFLFRIAETSRKYIYMYISVKTVSKTSPTAISFSVKIREHFDASFTYKNHKVLYSSR